MPTWEEWFKAAYYNPATKSFNPHATGTSVDTSLANFDNTIGETVVVGKYSSPSFYGTYDQNGNVEELIELKTVIVGGNYSDDSEHMTWNYKEDIWQGTKKTASKGFRVVSFSGISKEVTQNDVAKMTLHEEAGVFVDNLQAEKIGEWMESTHNKIFYGLNYIHDKGEGKGQKKVIFTAELKKTGQYEVRVGYTHGTNRSENVPVTISHAGGETTLHVNQREVPPISSNFKVLGRYQFEEGKAVVTVSNTGTKNVTIADGVVFVPLIEIGKEYFITNFYKQTKKAPTYENEDFTLEWSLNQAQIGESYKMDISNSYSDHNESTLSFGSFVGPNWLRLSTDGQLSGTPVTGEHLGRYSVKFTVSDSDDMYHITDVPINISVIQKLAATEGNDVLNGIKGVTWILGLSGEDQINGSAEGETIDGGAGNDTIDGGAGSDRVRYSGKRTDYSLVSSPIQSIVKFFF